MVTVHHTAEQPVQSTTDQHTSSTHRAERTGRALADTTLKEIIAAQEEIFVRRQPNSAHLAEAAQQHLAGGVTSSWQITAPQPVWLSHGHGSKVYDVDGNEYVDLHGGYGAALAGHAHPAIQQAIAMQVTKRHPLRPADPERHRGGPRTRPPLRPAPLAVRQLRHRGHHGRHPPHALHHRPRPDHQDRGLLPRPPRLGPGLRRPGTGTSRPSRHAVQRAVLHRHPESHHRPDPDRHVQRPGQRGQAPGNPQGPGRGHDHRADHDERRHHQARARLPRQPESPPPPAPRPAHLRRGEDRPHRRPGRCHQTRRRPARPHHAGQVPGRRRLGGRDRRHGGRHGPRGQRRLRDGGYVQRQPAGHGRHPRHAARGGHARGLRAHRKAPPPGQDRHRAGHRRRQV